MDLLTIKEFARLRNLPVRTVYRLTSEGLLPKIVFNQKTIRIPADEAEAVLEDLTQHSLVKGGAKDRS